MTNLAWDISKAGTGAGFIIMQLYRSLPIASWFWSGAFFPPSSNSWPIKAAHIQIHIPRVRSDYTPRGAARPHRTA